MTIKKNKYGILYSVLALILLSIACQSKKDNKTTYSDIQIVDAMKNVMWKGELAGKIHLDSIKNKTGLYGLGPESYLAGEILIVDGTCYVSRVTSDSTMSVTRTFDVSAPFFVHANVTQWNTIEVPKNLKTISDLQTFIDQKTIALKRPFAFKLEGTIEQAQIHIQNLPKGTKVSSPKQAHQGQVNYQLPNESVTIIGFFSTEHQGIFTHHDSYLHMHLITKDERQMGHLDALEIDKMILFLPKK